MRTVQIQVYNINELSENSQQTAIQQIAEELNDSFCNYLYYEELEYYSEEFQNKYGVLFRPKDISIDTDYRICTCCGVKDGDVDLIKLCRAAKVSQTVIDFLVDHSDELTIQTDEKNLYVCLDVEGEIPQHIHAEMEGLSETLTQFLNQKFEKLAKDMANNWEEYISDGVCIDFANDNEYEFYASGIRYKE